MKRLAATLAAFSLAAALPAQANVPATPGEALMKRVDIAQRLGESLPLDARFTDEDGREIALGEVFGTKPVVLALVYYECPMLCTLVMNGLLKSLRAVHFEAGKEFDVVAISIDPGEGPELAAAKKASVLDAYKRGTPQGWHFLTGKEADIARVAEAAGFSYAYDAERDEYAHAAMIAVATPEGKLSRYFFGIEYAPRDLKLALVEASDGRIGGLVERLLLLCYHYDPTTGRYSMAALTAVRAGGALTVLLIGVSIVGMIRRERRRDDA